MDYLTGYLKTAVLMAGMTALFMGVGYMVGAEQGLVAALVMALVMNVWTYWNSGKSVLRRYKAKPATEKNAPGLQAMVQQMAEADGMPVPKVYVIKNPQPNAFATGRNPKNAVVAATTGLLERLTPEEVAGVMAHELAHIKNRDILIMTITASIAGALSGLINMLMFFSGGRRVGFLGTMLLMILAPIMASIVQMAISRSREYEADRVGAEICGRPEWLASALEKISGHAKVIDNVTAENNPATAHMFIINPLHMRAIDGLFSTHPKAEERIRRLREMKL